MYVNKYASTASMFHSLIHPKTWCNTKSNTCIAIYEYLSTLTEQQTIIATL
jgi:hypothetical protein